MAAVGCGVPCRATQPEEARSLLGGLDELVMDSVSLNNPRALSAAGQISVSHIHVQIHEFTASPESRCPSTAELLHRPAESGGLQQPGEIFMAIVLSFRGFVGPSRGRCVRAGFG